MNASRIVTTLVIALAMLFARAADAKPAHKHLDGEKALGDKIKKDGTHQVHKNGNHTATVDVKGGKIAGYHVKHSKKGDLPIKKYKSDKKVASIEISDPTMPADTMVGTTQCGYSYIDADTGDEVFSWYSCAIVVDDFTGAITYVPLQ